MKPIPNEILLEQLNWRYATKRFDNSRKISDDDINTLKHILKLSPSSFGLQPWKFLFVSNPEIRNKLKEQSWGQTQITEASHLIVLTTKQNVNSTDAEKLIKATAQTRNIPEASLDKYKSLMLGFFKSLPPGFDVNGWSSRQVYLALGFLLSSCALLGIDACPMEGITTTEYDKILGLDEKEYKTSVVCTVGYRSEEDAYASYKKVRYDMDEVIQDYK